MRKLYGTFPIIGTSVNDADHRKNTTMTILDLDMQRGNDARAKTIRDYFKALLKAILTEEDGFSGKRPFGNSGWMHDLYVPMVKAGVVPGTLDADGYLEDCDREAALKKLLAAVKEM